MVTLRGMLRLLINTTPTSELAWWCVRLVSPLYAAQSSARRELKYSISAALLVCAVSRLHTGSPWGPTACTRGPTCSASLCLQQLVLCGSLGTICSTSISTSIFVPANLVCGLSRVLSPRLPIQVIVARVKLLGARLYLVEAAHKVSAPTDYSTDSH